MSRASSVKSPSDLCDETKRADLSNVPKSWEERGRTRRSGQHNRRQRRYSRRTPQPFAKRYTLSSRLKHDIAKETVLCLQENQENMRTPEEGVSNEGETDHCLVLAHSHYVVSGSIGVTAQVQKPWPIIVDTGSGFNVIRRSALPDGWKKFITASNDLPTLGDANGNALVVQHQVLLRVRLGNALYRVLFYVVDHLACPVLLGTQFANRHIEAIRCI